MTSQVSREMLKAKLNEASSVSLPDLTRRDARAPAIARKALAVIGVRRGGKTSWMQSRMSKQVAEGRPRESQLLLSLEDERLAGMTAADLGWMVTEHTREHPALLDQGVSLYLDEVQLVPGWESLVRRLIDAGGYEIFVSGSSAKLLSREVATSLRGRGMELLIHPFSFREALRHAGEEPEVAWGSLPPSSRVRMDAAVRRYVETGGFPEAQGTAAADRLALLKGYVDVMMLRDVIDRHGVTNVAALRSLQRQLLASPGGNFTVNKLADSLRSQGVAVGRETLHAYLDHLEDAFVVRTISMHSASERQRMTNPRKAYPVDTGLIPLYERTGRQQRGRALETAVLLELERRSYNVDWVRVPDGWEVDFLAEKTGTDSLLIQVCLDTSMDATWEREVRALESAARSFPHATPLLITLDSSPPSRRLPRGLRWKSVAEWLLEARISE